jgi:hypothetical protein
VFPPSLQSFLCVWGFVNCWDNWTQYFFHFPCITQIYIQRNSLGVSLCSLLLSVIFSYMFRLIWAAMMENHIKQKTCVKTQLCILARMCNYTCIRLQQVLCIHYTYCLKLDGFKCWQVCVQPSQFMYIQKLLYGIDMCICTNILEHPLCTHNLLCHIHALFIHTCVCMHIFSCILFHLVMAQMSWMNRRK